MWEQLLAAINAANMPLAERLVDQMKSADFDKDWNKIPWNQNPVYLAMHYNYESVLYAITSKNPLSVSTYIGHQGKTVIQHAAEIGSERIVTKILSAKPESANVVDNYGQTALHHAVLPGIVLKDKAKQMAKLTGREQIAIKLLSVKPGLLWSRNK